MASGWGVFCCINKRGSTCGGFAFANFPFVLQTCQKSAGGGVSVTTVTQGLRLPEATPAGDTVRSACVCLVTGTREGEGASALLPPEKNILFPCTFTTPLQRRFSYYLFIESEKLRLRIEKGDQDPNPQTVGSTAVVKRCL